MHLLVSSHPYALISSGSYALACIPASHYPKVHVCLLVSLHPYILILHPYIIHVCLFVTLHPHILISSGSCVLHSHILISWGSCMLACILTSSHPHILRFMCTCWYPRILTSSYLQAYMCLLVCSHPQVNVFLIRMNNCILVSSNSLVLTNFTSQFVKNLQILWTGQAFVLDFYCTSRKI